jgi:hypothetical protein
MRLPGKIFSDPPFLSIPRKDIDKAESPENSHKKKGYIAAWAVSKDETGQVQQWKRFIFDRMKTADVKDILSDPAQEGGETAAVCSKICSRKHQDITDQPGSDQIKHTVVVDVIADRDIISASESQSQDKQKYCRAKIPGRFFFQKFFLTHKPAKIHIAGADENLL